MHLTLSTVAVVVALALPSQSSTEQELAQYRLTAPVLARFTHATRLILDATGDDVRFAEDPLFSREFSVSGDAVAMAARLQARLDREPAALAALFAADIATPEYVRFAISLFAARLAHGFVASGAMRAVPPGAPRDNVAFIDAHRTEVAALLKAVGLEW